MQQALMKDLQPIKPVAEKLYELAAELLRCVDVDEQERERYIEDVRRNGCKIMPFPIKEDKDEEESAGLYFTEKEIKALPKNFRSKFENHKNISYREETGVYEVRKQIDGVSYFGSSKNRDEAVRKFLQDIRNGGKPARGTRAPVPEVEEAAPPRPAFNDVAAQWLELRKPLIKATTYEHYESLFRANVFPAFGGRAVEEIRQSDCQELINAYVEQGKNRTADKIYLTLKAVFEFAVGEELIARSPMRFIKPPQYEEKNGVALTLEEERELLKLIAESKCDEVIKHALVFLLYTGIRRSELASAELEGGFVSVICSKVRKGFQEKRRLIPITPMLARWLPQMNVDELRDVRPDALTQAMKRLMPEHHLHELRHTFITRAQECGVPREVVSVWAGHAADNTQTSNVYTHFSREFMQEQARKVDYII